MAAGQAETFKVGTLPGWAPKTLHEACFSLEIIARLRSATQLGALRSHQALENAARAYATAFENTASALLLRTWRSKALSGVLIHWTFENITRA